MVVLFSINTLLTPTHTHTHPCQTRIKWLVMGRCFVFLFFSTHRLYLIQFLSAGTQTHCQHHRHHPCLDILEPPENDVLIFLCGRGGDSRRRREGDGGAAHGLFFPSCLRIYLCPSTSHPLKVCVCVFVGTCAPCFPGVAFWWPSSKGGLHQRGQNHKRPVIVHERSFVKCLSPQRRRDVSCCLLALLHISMWHVNMSQRIKCCSRAFLLPKYLHAVLCVCVSVSGRETWSIEVNFKKKKIDYRGTSKVFKISRYSWYEKCPFSVSLMIINRIDLTAQLCYNTCDV